MLPSQRHPHRLQRKERSQPVLEVLCQVLCWAQVLCWVQILCWVQVLGRAPRTKAAARVLGAELGFQSRRGTVSSLCVSLSALLYSLFAHHSPSVRPQQAWMKPLPAAPFHRPSLTFLAQRPLVAHGPQVSSESGVGRHTTSSLGPCLPWSPAEACRVTETGVRAAGREALRLNKCFSVRKQQ